jgi:hypothetical protein
MRFYSVSVVVACISSFAVSKSAPGDDQTQPSQKFRIVSENRVEVDFPGNPIKVTGEVDLSYSWTRRDRDRVLAFDSIRVKASKNGSESMNLFMSRSLVRNSESGKIIEMPFDQSPENVQQLLRDSFDVPICEIRVDEKGKELKRTIVAGQGAKRFVENGTITSAVLFHSVFERDKKEWQSDAEISMGNGGFAKGKLKYVKGSSNERGVICEVSGTLVNDEFKFAGMPLTCKNARYEVSGDQTYLPGMEEWVNGKMSILVTMDMSSEANPKVPAKGTMDIKFERIGAKK